MLPPGSKPRLTRVQGLSTAYDEILVQKHKYRPVRGGALGRGSSGSLGQDDGLLLCLLRLLFLLSLDVRVDRFDARLFRSDGF